MKKFLLLFLSLCSIPVIAQTQTKVAVYVVESTVDDGVKKIIGSEMVSAIVANKDYQAVERTPVFLEQLSKEQNYGDNQQISQIGKQIGVDNVCVVDITAIQSSYYVQARLLEVNEAVVLATAREITTLSSIDDIVSTTELIASKLIGEDALKNQIGKEYSTIGFMSEETKNFHVISIDNTGLLTKMTFKYCTPKETWICIKPETHLYSKTENKRYTLVDIEGISFAPNKTYISKGIHTFSLYFEKFQDHIDNIDFIEPDGWCVYEMTLRPFGKRNYHVFADNSESNYENICLQYSSYLQQQEQLKRRQQEEQRKAEEAGEHLAKTIENIFTYNLHVMNMKHFPRAIWVGDRYVGMVKGKSEATFKVATTYYGSAKSVQTKGYVMYPTTETFYISKPYSGQTVVWVIR